MYHSYLLNHCYIAIFSLAITASCYHQNPQITDDTKSNQAYQETPKKKEIKTFTEITEVRSVKWIPKRRPQIEAPLSKSQKAAQVGFEGKFFIAPPKTLDQIAKVYHPDAQGTVVLVQYGDSHTEAGFFTKALRNNLMKNENLLFSPGLIQANKPSPWHADVQMSSHWQRQNLLYAQDIPPYGPLGISFHTQQPNAKATLTLKDRADIPYAMVKVLIAKKYPRLPFILKTNARMILEVPAQLEAETLGNQSNQEENQNTNNHQQDNKHQQPFHQTNLYYDEYIVNMKIDEELILETKEMNYSSKNKAKDPSKINIAQKNTNPSIPTQENHFKISAKDLQNRDHQKANQSPLHQKPSIQKVSEESEVNDFENDRDESVLNEKNGSLVLLGFQTSYPNASVDADVFGIRSASADHLLRTDASAIQYLKDRKPDLVLFWYGTNSAANENLDIDQYARQYRSMLRRFKEASQQSSCIAIGPPDFGRRNPLCYLNQNQKKAYLKSPKSDRTKALLSQNRKNRVCSPQSFMKTEIKHKGKNSKSTDQYLVADIKTQEQWLSHQHSCAFKPPRPLLKINEVQKRIAQEEGCAYYDMLGAMGGIGSIHQWACADPQWASLDLIHLTGAGYEALGTDLAHWIRYALGEDDMEPVMISPAQSQ